MSHTPENRIIVFRQVKHHTRFLLYDKTCMTPNISLTELNQSCNSTEYI